MNNQQIFKGADEIFCPSCGAVIKSQAVICVNCGVPLRELLGSRTPSNKTSAIFLYDLSSHDRSDPTDIRLNQLLTRLARANRKIQRNKGIWSITIAPLIVGNIIGMVILATVMGTGMALIGNPPKPPDWLMGLIVVPCWLAGTVLFVVLFHRRGRKKHAAKLDELQKQVETTVKQISLEFPDYVQKYGGGENALKEFEG